MNLGIQWHKVKTKTQNADEFLFFDDLQDIMQPLRIFYCLEFVSNHAAKKFHENAV
jgi:hypothetical protein